MGLMRKKAGPASGGPASGGAAPTSDAADPTDADPVRMLAGADAASRRRAAHDLAHRPDAVAPLAARLAEEADAGVREAILTALARIATAQAALALVPFLDREDAALRNGALESIQQMPATVAAPALLPLLDHPDADLRIFAVQGLGGLAHPDRPLWLAAVLERDPHVNVGLTAVEALAEAGSPEALSSLERLAARFPDDPFVPFAVDAARRSFQGG